MDVLWVFAHPDHYSMNASLRAALARKRVSATSRSSARRDRLTVAAWILVAAASGALPLIAEVMSTIL